MTKKGRANGSFFGNHIFENLLSRRPHLLYEFCQMVDCSFVRYACRDFAVDWGRDAWNMVDLFRVKQEYARKNDDFDRTSIDCGSHDSGARLGRTSKQKVFCG